MVPLLSVKHLDDLPSRVLTFWLRMVRFSCTMYHIPGKHLCTADALSQKPKHNAPNIDPVEEEAEGFMSIIKARKVGCQVFI